MASGHIELTGGLPLEPDEYLFEQRERLLQETAQEFVVRNGRAFNFLTVDHNPVDGEMWAGYETRVVLRVDNEFTTGYQESHSVFGSVDGAFNQSLQEKFPQVRTVTSRPIEKEDKTYAVEFMGFGYTWVSDLDGDLQSLQVLSQALSDGYNVAVHLVRNGK